MEKNKKKIIKLVSFVRDNRGISPEAIGKICNLSRTKLKTFQQRLLQNTQSYTNENPK